MKMHVINALMLKYWYITINSLDRIFDIVYWPVIGLLLWGFTARFVNSFSDNSILPIFLGGFVLFVFFERAQQDAAIYILEDFWSKSVYYVFASPIRKIELIVSNILFAMLRAFISLAFLIIICFGLYSFNVFDAGIFAVALFVFQLLVFAWAFGIFVTAMIFRYGVRIQIFAWSFAWLIQPFSAVYYPLNSLPIWMQKIGVWIPITHVFEGFRQAFRDGTVSWYNMLFAFVLNIAFLLVAYLFFNLSLKKAEKTGLLVKGD